MKQTPKKIVSKGEYIRAVGNMTLSRVVGGIFYGLSLLSALITVGCFCMVVSGRVLAEDGASPYVMCVPGLVLFAPLTYFLYRAGQNGFVRASKITPSVPFTRANTGDLPADETLVRASEQSVNPQQDVLVRPVEETQDAHEEQLLRGSIAIEP